MRFDKVPAKWEEAPYFANGCIGSMIYADTTADTKIKIPVFRTDVQDHKGDTTGWAAYASTMLSILVFLISLKGMVNQLKRLRKTHTIIEFSLIFSTPASLMLICFETVKLPTVLQGTSVGSFLIKIWCLSKYCYP